MTPNAKSWFDFATRPVADGGLGLTEAQAAGKVANLQAESTPNITPWGETGDKGTAQGSAQWRGDRLRNLVNFSKANGMDYHTTEAQQAFMRHEYLGSGDYGGGSEGKAYAALSATRSPQEAATAVNRYYERSADKSGRREAGAARLGGSNVPPNTPVVAQGNTPSSAWAARPPLSAALVDPNASPLDNAPYPQGNVGAPQAVAQGGDPNSPPGVAPPLQERAVPAAPVVASDAPEARAVQNLTSGQPAAAAGLDREQLAQMYRNPITRPLATAILQKQMDPGSYTYEKIGDRLMALHNKDPRLNKEVARGPLVVGGSIATEDPSRPGQYGFQTPPEAPKVIHQKEDEIVRVPIPGRPGEYTTFGGEGVGKIQREIDTRTQAALAKGYPQETADYYGMNGKLPKDDLTAKEVGTLTDNQKMVNSGKMVLDNVAEMKRLSPEAWSGMGATERAAITSKILPGFLIPKGATNTEVLSNLALQNVAGQAKAMFGARLAFGEVKLLERLETTPNMSRATREAIYPQIERIINRHNNEIEAENEAIRNKTYKKPGGGPTHGAPTAAPSIQWSIVPQ
jgi:hypothetical protein